MIVARFALLATGLVLVASGCGFGRSDAFPDRVAEVTIGDRTVTYQLDSCGLDGQTAFLVGRSEGGSVLQAVVGVDVDGETGVAESTGITVFDFDDTSFSAFGDEAWERRGESGESPGDIDDSRVRGARIQAEGQAVSVDEDEVPTGPDLVKVRLDARCDE